MQSKREILSGHTLVIDVSGLIFYLLENYIDEEDACWTKMGDYTHIHAIVVEHIGRIRACQINCICVFDGTGNRMHSVSSAQREIDRLQVSLHCRRSPLPSSSLIFPVIQQEWVNLRDLCNSQQTCRTRSSIPLPPLIFQQIKYSLTAVDVLCISAEGEADQLIARICHSRNNDSERGERYICHGRDSDYMVMDACPYVQFRDLELDARSSTARYNMAINI